MGGIWGQNSPCIFFFMNNPPKQLGVARGGFVILYQSGRAEALYTEGHWLLRVLYVEENLHV